MGKIEQAILLEPMVYLANLRRDAAVWNPTAGEAARWWRQRARMTMVEDGKNCRIEGEGSERAHIAYATPHAGRLEYTLDPIQPEESLRSNRFGVSPRRDEFSLQQLSGIPECTAQRCSDLIRSIVMAHTSKTLA